MLKKHAHQMQHILSRLIELLECEVENIESGMRLPKNVIADFAKLIPIFRAIEDLHLEEKPNIDDIEIINKFIEKYREVK